MLRIAFALVLLACPALAEEWPQPALGESVSGDTEVLFTFDDGPNPTWTPEVLDILAAHNIKAVFFLVGKQITDDNTKIPGIVQRILAEGHVIGSHSWNHADLCRVKEEATAVHEIDAGKEAVEKVSGIPVEWFRVPYGVRCERVDRLLAERHMTHFHWDLDPQEWKNGNLERTVKYMTTELAHAHGREVILMHDIKRVTVRALPLILDWIDEENAKRAKSHKHQIRILSAPMIAIERMNAGVRDWFLEATADLRALPGAIAKLLPAS